MRTIDIITKRSYLHRNSHFMHFDFSLFSSSPLFYCIYSANIMIIFMSFNISLFIFEHCHHHHQHHQPIQCAKRCCKCIWCYCISFTIWCVWRFLFFFYSSLFIPSHVLETVVNLVDMWCGECQFHSLNKSNNFFFFRSCCFF